MSKTTFLEIVFVGADFAFDGRDEVEDPLNEALRNAGLGKVTGGGGGMGECNIDVEVIDSIRGLAFIREQLRALEVARSTVINQYEPEHVIHKVYE